MPTANRRRFIPTTLHLFLAQDYEDKELVIIDDGTDPINDLIPKSHPNITYLREKPNRLSLGEKRNLGCEAARGDVILHWDDDDWYAPWRISYQVASLQHSDLDICGVNNMYFLDASRRSAWEYVCRGDVRWLGGASLCYKKSTWTRTPFVKIDVGEDARFVRCARYALVGALEDNRFLVVRVHSSNTCTKQPSRCTMRSLETIHTIIGRDWHNYWAAESLIEPSEGFEGAEDVRSYSVPVITRARHLTDPVTDFMRLHFGTGNRGVLGAQPNERVPNFALLSHMPFGDFPNLGYPRSRTGAVPHRAPSRRSIARRSNQH
jgi:glycosyltransferase involved in cell wall biosynthesis